MGFDPLRRLRQSGAHLPRACLTRYVALTGFLSLLALYFSRRLPALFHAGNALGVPPSRAFPPRQAGTPSRGPLPSCRWPPRCSSTPRPQAGRGSVAPAPLFRNRRSPMLSWAFIPSRVFPSPAMEPRMGSSSHELFRGRLAVPSAEALQSITRRENWLDSLEPADPPGVSRLIVLPTQTRAPFRHLSDSPFVP
jgi:hypothetical protein